MFSRRTSSRTRKSRERMLHLKVSSPRIVYFDCLKFAGRFVKLGLVLAIMVGVGVGLGYGWQKLFVENDEFVISRVEIFGPGGEEPRFLTHERMVNKTGLDLGKTIFAVESDELAESLSALPEVTSARVSRRLPGTLKVEVEERQPVAWVACRSLGIRERDRNKGLLLDREGVPFRCESQKLWEFSEQLPVVMVEEARVDEIREGVALEHKGLKHALALILRAQDLLDLTEQPLWVLVKDEIFLEMKTRGGVVATLSYYDQERQLEQLVKVTTHARRQGRELAQVNLIPRRYVPVHYR